MEDDEQSNTPAAPAQDKPKKRKRPYMHTGATALQNAVNRLAGNVIDKSTPVGLALDEWRREVVADLGGAEVLSASQHALVDLACRQKLMLDSIDAWILNYQANHALVHSKKKTIIPVVRERDAKAANLVALLKELGLKRIKPAVPPVADFLRDLAAEPRPPKPTKQEPPGATISPEPTERASDAPIASGRRDGEAEAAIPDDLLPPPEGEAVQPVSSSDPVAEPAVVTIDSGMDSADVATWTAGRSTTRR